MDILPAMERFIQKHPDAQFNLIGFDKSLLSKEQIDRCNLNIIPWSEKTEVREILKFDVGIMPLRDNPWSRGKCGFKLIQYMSCRKSLIASPVGINSDIVKDGENGLLAKSEDEWYEAFKTYIVIES